MRIGIDARFLTHPQRGGFKTYTVNLINAIHQIDEDNEYVIYLDRPPEAGQFPMKKNFEYRIVNGTLPVIGMPVREQSLLRYYVSKDRLDVLHSLCNTSPVRLNLKKVITLHDTIQATTKIRFTAPPGIKYWMIMAYSKWVIKQSMMDLGRIITVSEYEKRQIQKLFNIPSENIAVTHLAANEIFKPVNAEEKDRLSRELENNFGIHGNYLFGVGYEDRKNIPLLIDAYRLLASDFPDLSLVVVAAEETKRRQFTQLVRDYQLEGRVHIFGSLSPANLVALYNLAKVFVFPSDRESFGLPPLESISCGTPVIAMNSSSLPEILGNGALFVDGKDPQRWADAIYAVLKDEKVLPAMAAKGLKRAAELNWKKCASETLEVYKQATNSI